MEYEEAIILLILPTNIYLLSFRVESGEAIPVPRTLTVYGRVSLARPNQTLIRAIVSQRYLHTIPATVKYANIVGLDFCSARKRACHILNGNISSFRR